MRKLFCTGDSITGSSFYICSPNLYRCRVTGETVDLSQCGAQNKEADNEKEKEKKVRIYQRN